MIAVLRHHNERIALVVIASGFLWFTLAEMPR